VFILGNELGERVTKLLHRESSNGDMHMGDDVPVRLDGEEVIEWRFIVEMERLDIFKFIKFLASNNAFGSEVEWDDSWFMTQGEVPCHTNQDKSDSHDWTIGIECPADNHNEGDNRNDASPRPEFERVVFWSIPVEENITVSRSEDGEF